MEAAVAATPFRNLPDLVLDSRIETNILTTHVEHVFYEAGQTPLERRRRRVERWFRDEVLGRGAYGVVYKERQENGSVQTLRAVKEISKSVVEGEKLDYTRELEAVIKFSHSRYSHCFVRSDGWFENEHSIFIAMEHIELGDLQRHLTQALPEPEVRQITIQVLEGLSFMHENGFVHRDLKPGNIMVVSRTPRWFVKITDFGISKRRQQGVTTLHTMQRGTLGFAAPEVLGMDGAEGSYTFAVDIWSLGAVTYYMLTNSMAFENPFEMVMYAMGTKPFSTGLLQANNVSGPAIAFVTCLLAPTPQARPSVKEAAKHEWLAVDMTMSVNDELARLR
jgi:serine/threonine protein kinase